MVRPGVAAIIIGNEVLSAKVEEQNGAHLIRRLRQRRVPLRQLTIVPDEVDAIVEAVAHARQAGAFVVTSGGIGPTHDDVTVRAVALALGRAVERRPEIVALIGARYGEATAPPEVLRLADAPQGAQLLFQEGIWYPVLSCQNVFMLPGVPPLFRLQLETVLPRFSPQPWVVRSVLIELREAELAQLLERVAVAIPQVAIGSYPQFDQWVEQRVRVTFEGEDAALVQAALEAVVSALPPGVRHVQERDERG